jgi:aminoglycoside phosphotransferase (APT) family kinase protein
VTEKSPLDSLRAPLECWLAERLAAARVGVSELERPSVGQSNDTVLFTASWTDGTMRRARLVLRRQQLENAIFHEPDVIREASVIQALRTGSRVPVPEVRWTEPSADVLGAPFFVMSEVSGRVAAARPSIHVAGWLPTLTTRERERLWSSAMETVAAVHDVDWRQTHGFLIGDDPVSATLDAYVDRLAAWYRSTTAARAFPITDAALDYVMRHRSEVRTGAPVLVWGDARVGNMIFGEQLAVAAAVDWEVASIGPAAVDVAHWLFFDEFATHACGIEPLPGWPDRATTVARYEALSGRIVDDLEYFELMDELFMATTLIRQADARVARGLAPPDTRMGHDNTVTQMLARRLGLQVPDLSPDYVAHRGGAAR